MYPARDEAGVETVIPVRKSATSGVHRSTKSNKYRRRATREYRRLGYRAWAESKGYGKRWPGTEGIFSAMKRKFGENLVARSAGGLSAEGYQRVWAYDVLREYGQANALVGRTKGPMR